MIIISSLGSRGIEKSHLRTRIQKDERPLQREVEAKMNHSVEE